MSGRRSSAAAASSWSWGSAIIVLQRAVALQLGTDDEPVHETWGLLETIRFSSASILKMLRLHRTMMHRATVPQVRITRTWAVRALTSSTQSAEPTFEGGCYCQKVLVLSSGSAKFAVQVQFRVTGKPLYTGFCHCSIWYAFAGFTSHFFSVPVTQDQIDPLQQDGFRRISSC